jgi:hypothetical protein
MSAIPGYWMHEQSGLLRPVILAYLEGAELAPEEMALMRAYLRQWIDHPVWQGTDIDQLRATVGSLTTRHDISRWLDVAERNGIDPL